VDPPGGVRGHGWGGVWRGPALLRVVDEVAPRTVGAQTDGVEGPAEVRLVLRVSIHRAKFRLAVGELALLSVLAEAVFLEGATQLCFVAR